MPASPPLVSCLMVTRGALSPARFAIDCYRRQDWPTRELIIVTDAPHAALARHVASLGDPSIRIVAAEPAPLGALRNRSLAEARGDLVCQWDDDDLYAPSRIREQVEALGDHEAVFLHRWLVWQPARRRLAIGNFRLWEGSMLARKACVPLYPEIARLEDTPVTDAMRAGGKVALLDRPSLYCYIVHGANTWDAPHFNRMFAHASRRFEFAEYERALAKLAATMPVHDYAAALDLA